MDTLFTHPALPWRTIQQADKFTPFGSLRRVLIHCLQALAHTVIRRSTLCSAILGFIPKCARSGVDICWWGVDAGNARASIHVHANVRTFGVLLWLWLQKSEGKHDHVT